KRARRQLRFPGLRGLGDIDPVLRSGGGDLTLPRGFKLETYPDNCFSASQSPGSPRHVSSPRNNPPLDPLTSIDRFATVFKLTSSPGDSVVSTLQREGLTTLLVLLETSGLLNFLISGERGPYILLAPSEAAFSRLSRNELRQLSRGNDLGYHLIPLLGRPAPEVMNDSTFKTMLGHELRFNVYDGSVYVNGAAVSRGDVPFSHGTIQVVESVLEVPLGDVQTVLVGSGHSYSRANTLLSVTNLMQSGTYTLLAPPDSAITSKGYSWPGLLMDRALGQDLLARHTIRGAWYTEGLLQKRTLTTLAGTRVTFRKDQDGTVSVNGVPLRSNNLTATNGVVHLAADLIPESDLGSDPTTIPNPLLSQTESPIYQSFTFGGDIIPDVPPISGLYETPDRDPFLDFIPKIGTVSDEHSGKDTPQQTSSGPDSQHARVPTFQEYIARFTIDRVPPTENNIYTYSYQSSTDPNLNPESVQTPRFLNRQQTEGTDSQQSPESQDNESSMPDNFSFLETSDETYKEQPRYNTHTPFVDDFSRFGNYGTRTTGDFISTLTSPQIKNTYQTINEEGNSVYVANVVSPQPHLPQENSRNCSDADCPRATSPANENRTSVDTQGYFNDAQETFSGSPFGRPNTVIDPQAFSEDQAVSPIVSRVQVPLVPVVPESVVVWSRPGALTNEERSQLDVLSLLERLNLTRFTELINRAGLTLTLSLDGGSVITDLDEEATNGVVHVVDRVLYAPYGDLHTTLALSPALTSFTNLITNDTPLLHSLSGSGPVTLFVPSNNAFTNLTLPQNPQAMREWVLSHMVEGRWYTAGFSNMWPLCSLNNSTLTTVLTGQENVTVNGVDISYADITTTNGVIHVLESPLFTPT
ncbi:Transforming growth factor-beta-induced protein ig-h3-like 1, partial [Homarus americanus]